MTLILLTHGTQTYMLLKRYNHCRAMSKRRKLNDVGDLPVDVAREILSADAYEKDVCRGDETAKIQQRFYGKSHRAISKHITSATSVVQGWRAEGAIPKNAKVYFRVRNLPNVDKWLNEHGLSIKKCTSEPASEERGSGRKQKGNVRDASVVTAALVPTVVDNTAVSSSVEDDWLQNGDVPPAVPREKDDDYGIDMRIHSSPKDGPAASVISGCTGIAENRRG